MEIKTIGIDLAKSVFQLHGVDSEGRPLLRKRCKRCGSAGNLLAGGQSGAGHSVYFERPGESNLTLENFLRESLC